MRIIIIIKGLGQLIARGLPAERVAPLIFSNAIKSGEKNQNRIYVQVFAQICPQIFAQIFVQMPSNQVRTIMTNRMTMICTALSGWKNIYVEVQVELHDLSTI